MKSAAVFKNLTLTERQSQCVESRAQHMLIRGVPGSGKTVVILKRALKLAATSSSINLFTFNRTLADYAKELLTQAKAEGIHVSTFDSWAFHQYNRLSERRRNLINEHERERMIKRAITSARASLRNEMSRWRNSALFDRPLEFWKTEIDWIRGRGIFATEVQRDEYLAIDRAGRGSALNRELRQIVWLALLEYSRLLRANHLVDFEGITLTLLHKKDALPKVDHVLVDEAQDLTAARLRLLIHTARQTVTISADEGQRIYPTTFAWRDLGLDIVGGGRSRHLPHTHRSTRQIVDFVRHLRAKIPEMADEDIVVPDAEGPVPMVHATPDGERELSTLVEVVRALRTSDPETSIGVLARRHALLDRVEVALKRARIHFVGLGKLRDGTGVSVMSPGVKLCSFHSAKGLEFDHVVAFHVEDGVVPPEPEPSADEEDIAEQHAFERRLLYVALSRPRLTLHVTHAASPSRFLEEIPSGAFELIAYAG